MELTKKIGLRLREARRAQGLSLAELARRTNDLSKSRISNYEQGIRRMGIEEAQVLSTALGTVTATYLLCLDDNGLISGPERDLLEYYRQADSRGKDTIQRVAESEAGYADRSGREAPDAGPRGG
jgi:transcriptional regulator with XRE-family HTH domain